MAVLAIKEEKEPMIGGMSEYRLEFHFDNWRRWMRHDVTADGAPGKASGCVGGGYSQTFDDMVDAADLRCARILDCLVNSLSPMERSAIYHHYLYAVWRARQAVLEQSLLRARIKVAEWLVIRGVY